jgi:hypothetical protein
MGRIAIWHRSSRLGIGIWLRPFEQVFSRLPRPADLVSTISLVR